MDVNTITETVIAPFRSPFLDSFFYALALITSEYIFIAILILLTLWAYTNKSVRAKIEFELTAVIGASLTTLFLKYVTAIQRPVPIPIAIQMEGNSSFPSMHATAVVAVVGSLFLTVYPRLTTKSERRMFLLLGAFWILLISLSRLYLRVHYLTDILAGSLIAILWIAITTYIMRR